MSPEPPLAFFLVRAWYEEGRLHARIRRSLDVSDPESEYLTTDPDEVIRYLRAWLHEVNPTIAPTSSPAPWLDANGA
jgi:hypothetical protein